MDVDENISPEDKPAEFGVNVIKGYVKNLPLKAGVYRMLDHAGQVLYVGKAKSLKKRVVSYTHFDKLPIRLKRMVAQTREMEFITTHTEAEALLLEANLIKKFQPRYNILLRDDKSFPYILIRDDHDFSQLQKHRGAQDIKGTYFGPFASAGDVNRTMAVLQRVFLLRNCTDHFFSHRERPCLQYHIKRCTAPCVGKVSRAEYAEQVAGARDFLDGKNREVQERLVRAMEIASNAMDYEKAALLRDRIRALTGIQSRQDIHLDIPDADIIGIYRHEGRSCVQVFFFRGGQNLGNKSYFPRHDVEENSSAILAAFMAQFYQNKPVPKFIYISEDVDDRGLIEAYLGEKIKSKVSVIVPHKGDKKRAIDFVLQNAREAFLRHEAENAAQGVLLAGVCTLFDMDEIPQRIEVYDNSHISGTNMVGAMIVADMQGFCKKSYRKFNIREARASDDYGMMREVMRRRFKNFADGVDEANDILPDLILIDGGVGQYNACKAVLEDIGIFDRFTVVAIAKGVDRNAGRENFIIGGRAEFQLPVNDPVLHYLQRLRDEAHRFAVSSHRIRRTKQSFLSPLDEIEGIGSARKKALLQYFGSAKAVAGAGIADLEKVEGISRSLAKKIYQHFNG